MQTMSISAPTSSSVLSSEATVEPATLAAQALPPGVAARPFCSRMPSLPLISKLVLANSLDSERMSCFRSGSSSGAAASAS